MASSQCDTPVLVVVVVGGGGGGANIYVCILCYACWGENVGYKCFVYFNSIFSSAPSHSFLACGLVSRQVGLWVGGVLLYYI
jgi:hypothetical protein